MDNLPTIHDVSFLARLELENTIANLMQDAKLSDNLTVVNAITNIVLQVAYLFAPNQTHVDNQIKSILESCQNPINRQDLKINKSALASMPLIWQLLALMQRHQRSEYSRNKVIWLAIAMHIGVTLYQRGQQTAYHNILMQFKQAVFSESPNRTWIWQKLLMSLIL